MKRILSAVVVAALVALSGAEEPATAIGQLTTLSLNDSARGFS